MSDDTIRNLLRKLNKGTGKNLIFKNSIGGNVEFAKVWIWKRGLYFYKDQNFFFVKNEEGKYVAAIYGVNNFHWYTLYEERAKGYLSSALKNFVIPYLWGSKRQEIHEPFEISISRGIGQKNFKSSLHLGKSVGFKIVEENDYNIKLHLSYDDFAKEGLAFPIIVPNLDQYSINSLSEKGKRLVDLFLQIKGELEVKLGKEVLDDFDHIPDLRFKLECVFEDYIWSKDIGSETQYRHNLK